MARRPKRSALVLAAIATVLAVTQQCAEDGRSRSYGGAVASAVTVTASAEAEADLTVAESNHHPRAALLNLPKFGDRLAPRSRPAVEEPVAPVVVPGSTGTGNSGSGSVVSSSSSVVGKTGGRQGRGQQFPGRGPQQNVHQQADIKRADVMLVSSRSAKGGVGGQTVGQQDLTLAAAADDEDEEVEQEPEEEDEEEGDDVEEEEDDEQEQEQEAPAIARSASAEFRGQVARADVPAGDRNDLQEVEEEQEHIVSRGPGPGPGPGLPLAVVVSEASSGGGGVVGNASSQAQAHRLEMSTEFFVVPSTAASAASRSTTVRPGGVILAARHPPSRDNIPTPPTIVAATASGDFGSGSSGLRKEPWVVPVLVLASLSMFMMAAFEVFVLCKAWRTSPSRRHLFLGQMLLLGLFACSGLAAVLTVTPTVLSCATMRFGAGVAFALVFASLLVKCVFLISLNGGVYLPAPYQGLLLLFAVLIQVAVGGQWLLTSPPSVDSVSVAASTTTTTTMTNTGSTAAVSSRYHLLMTASDLATMHPSSVASATTVIPLCHTPFSELLLSLIYIVFLIVFVAVLAIKSRGIRDNYREATYIGLAIGGIIPIWLGWTLCGLAVADRHRDACLAFGLVATSSTVFLVMFMPKGRQLAAMGKEGLYVEDREERFSSLSRAGSGYSPSFFHFKPIKYGVMGPSPTLQTGTGAALVGGGPGTTTTSKHQAVATLGGDRVALVTAPPSYTPRMYHYFPAHMTHPFCYYPSLAPQQARYPGLFMRPDETNLYTTLEQTMSSNPNVYFQRGGGVHPGMMY
ncbi:uncharacterized protein LOC125953770 [Anopheles darlingi]|uniref:uncharacterized protein LOC125953770 n=1 Tax=Anopheles darlingi TaxID=43151 RepID=UPI0021000170|nr:uncharacterized protein LOC125953770 [Anopheles darlingi]